MIELISCHLGVALLKTTLPSNIIKGNVSDGIVISADVVLQSEAAQLHVKGKIRFFQPSMTEYMNQIPMI